MPQNDREVQQQSDAGGHMVDVAIIGAGQTPYGNLSSTLKGMWAEAAQKAIASVDNTLRLR